MRINCANGHNAHRRYALVTIAASMGGVQALQKLLSGLPPDFPLPVAIVQHRTAAQPNLLARVLGRHTPLKVKTAEEDETLHAGTVYLAPPHLHLIVRRDESLALVNGRKIRHVSSAANPLFASAAQVFGDGVIAVVLTGGDRDATDGVQTVRHRGGIVIAQDEATSALFGMPHSAIATGAVNTVLPLQAIAPELERRGTALKGAGRIAGRGPRDARRHAVSVQRRHGVPVKGVRRGARQAAGSRLPLARHA